MKIQSDVIITLSCAEASKLAKIYGRFSENLYATIQKDLNLTELDIAILDKFQTKVFMAIIRDKNLPSENILS